MNKFKIVLIAASLLLSSSPVFADQCHPEWANGNQQLTSVERIVCEDKTIAAAAVLMADIYDEIMSYSGKEGYEGMWHREVKENQQEWLEKRNSLKTRDEILESYMTQIKALYSDNPVGTLKEMLSVSPNKG